VNDQGQTWFDVRERWVGGCGQDLDGAGGDPAVGGCMPGIGDCLAQIAGLVDCCRKDRDRPFQCWKESVFEVADPKKK
jgi:hypothetical protein